MYLAVCYDVASHRTRRRVVKVLEGYGRRVQKSVFECRLSDQQYAQLKSKLSQLFKKEGDLVRYYRLCERCVGNVEFSGGGPPVQGKSHMVI
jgi:CRISPR-associated protein Cas2